MKNPWILLALFLVTIISILEHVESCTCWASSLKATTREHFCWSQLVAVVNITNLNKPLSTQTPCGDQICYNPQDLDFKPTYDFKIVREFTPKGNGKEGGVNRIRTGRGGGDCGTQFNVNEEYLIFSKEQPDAEGIYIGICEFVRNWTTMTEEKRQKLIKDMKADTPCEPGIPDYRDPIFDSRP